MMILKSKWRIRECLRCRGSTRCLLRLCLVGMLFLVAVQLPGSLQLLKSQLTMMYKNLPGETATSVSTSGPTTVIHTGSSTRLRPSTRGQSTRVQEQVVSKRACLPGLVPQVPIKKYDKPGHPDVTVVTAFFNIGKFRKGSGSQMRGSDVYMKWGRVYRYLTNPLIMYTDSNVTADVFRKLRANVTSMTKIITLDRKDVWAFNYLDRIRTIYANPKYPKHNPNTVVPEYSCAQHAKYAVIEDAIKHNYFNTTYFTWIDIGYFRLISERETKFVIVKPPNFDEFRVAMNHLVECNILFEVEIIFKQNLVCIGGGMFFGSKKILSMFIGDYRTALERYLNMSLCNTDQQVIYSMNTFREKKALQRKVSLQLYKSDVSGDCWFYLGYLCYRHLH